MKRFLYCTSAAADEQMIPVDNIVGFDVQDATNLWVYNKGIDGINNNGIMKLTVTTGKHEEVQKAIVEAITYSTEAFITLADDQNKVYLHPNITGVAAVGVL